MKGLKVLFKLCDLIPSIIHIGGKAPLANLCFIIRVILKKDIDTILLNNLSVIFFLFTFLIRSIAAYIESVAVDIKKTVSVLVTMLIESCM